MKGWLERYVVVSPSFITPEFWFWLLAQQKQNMDKLFVQGVRLGFVRLELAEKMLMHFYVVN